MSNGTEILQGERLEVSTRDDEEWTNKDRAARVKAWLEGYGEEEDGTNEQLIDVLADLMHLVDQDKNYLDFETLAEEARNYFDTEKKREQRK